MCGYELNKRCSKCFGNLHSSDYRGDIRCPLNSTSGPKRCLKRQPLLRPAPTHPQRSGAVSWVGRKDVQSGNFQFDINPVHFKILSTRKLKHGNASKGILKTLFEKYKLELTHVFKLASITHSLRLIRNRIFSVKLEWSC